MNTKNMITFNKWALEGKDIKMQEGHKNSVDAMVEIIKNKTNILNKPFKFLDLGCGNGWVVRKFSNHSLCKLAVGVDESENMIKKAISYGKDEKYIRADIENWVIKTKFDIVFSMETFYYFSNPDKVIKNIFYNLLKNNGIIIIGIDHYFENKQSLNWDKQYNLNTNTFSISDWKKKFKSFRFKKLELINFGKEDDWEGTLIIYARK